MFTALCVIETLGMLRKLVQRHQGRMRKIDSLIFVGRVLFIKYQVEHNHLFLHLVVRNHQEHLMLQKSGMIRLGLAVEI